MSRDAETLVEDFALALDNAQRRLVLAAGDDFAPLDCSIGWIERNRCVNALKVVERRVTEAGVPEYRLTTLGLLSKAFLHEVAATPDYVAPAEELPIFRPVPPVPRQADLESLAESMGLRPRADGNDEPTLPGAAR